MSASTPAPTPTPAFPRADRKKLAQACGIQQSTVIHVLAGRRRPGARILEDLAGALGVTVTKLQSELRAARLRRAGLAK